MFIASFFSTVVQLKSADSILGLILRRLPLILSISEVNASATDVAGLACFVYISNLSNSCNNTVECYLERTE